MSMQKASIQGNLDARKLDMANSIARTWLDRLATDATAWNTTTGLTQTLWLNAVLSKGFVTPTAEPAGTPIWSAAFDIFGRDLTNEADPNTQFCTHISVVPVANDSLGAPLLLRATVLVFWAKNIVGSVGTPASPLCPGPNDVANYETSNPGTYHMLYVTEGLRRSS
jgi:hypothetical protein